MLLYQDLHWLIYLALLGVILQIEEFHTAFGLAGVNIGFAMILLIWVIEPAEIVVNILFNYLSRKAEVEADLFSKRHTNKKSIQNALKKLAQENLSDLSPHPFYQLLHYTHPSISDRLKAVDIE